MTLVARAPSAMRIPTSRVRRLTTKAITPYIPMAASSSAASAKVDMSCMPNRAPPRAAATTASIV